MPLIKAQTCEKLEKIKIKNKKNYHQIFHDKYKYVFLKIL